jgi:bacterioferritin
MANQFALDIEKIRSQARDHMSDGAVTTQSEAKTSQIVDILNDVLATEIVCWMRYQQHAIVSAGINRADVAAEFTEHAAQELNHALLAAARLSQLGADPDFSPSTLTKRSHTDYVTFESTDLEGMLKENLVAERIVIQIYQELVKWLADDDPTTRRMVEHILEEEEEHADDLIDLLGDLT